MLALSSGCIQLVSTSYLLLLVLTVVVILSDSFQIKSSSGSTISFKVKTKNRSLLLNKRQRPDTFPFLTVSTMTTDKTRKFAAAAPSSSDITTASSEYPRNNNNSDNKRQRRNDPSPTTVVINDNREDGVAINNNVQVIEHFMESYIDGMNQRAKEEQPFTDEELNDIVTSIHNLISNSDNNNDSIDEIELRTLLKQVAHLSHKNWQRTEENGILLGDVLKLDLHSTSTNDDNNLSRSRQILQRILIDGNWDGAAQHAKTERNINDEHQPWAVLVTGVNGIRKTTSIYQQWFPQLLQEALVVPVGCDQQLDASKIVPSTLPKGSNSFFRQLDHMIATLLNQDFARLYRNTRDLLIALENQETDNDVDESGTDDIIMATILTKEPPKEVIKKYSDWKAAIFTRYRTISELLGAHLLTEAKKVELNCMLETSGRDVAMFHYIDHFFKSDTKYRKLALHFTINDLQYAQDSVDQRMIQEIHTGIKALQSGSIQQIVQANAGGPYGSEVLPGVQFDSDRVWNEIVMNEKDNERVGKDWYKASIQINAHPTEPWTAQAIRRDGSLGTMFPFERISS